MFSPSTSKNMLGLWLIRRGLRMLSRPFWAIGAIAMPTSSPDKLAVHTCDIAPRLDQAPSAVSSALCALLSDIANGRVILPRHLQFGSPNDQGRESDGLRDAKSLHDTVRAEIAEGALLPAIVHPSRSI